MRTSDCVGFSLKVLEESKIPRSMAQFLHNGSHGAHQVDPEGESTIVVCSSARRVFTLKEQEEFVGSGAEGTKWSRPEGS